MGKALGNHPRAFELASGILYRLFRASVALCGQRKDMCFAVNASPDAILAQFDTAPGDQSAHVTLGHSRLGQVLVDEQTASPISLLARGAGDSPATVSRASSGLVCSSLSNPRILCGTSVCPTSWYL